jgi:hypothetical protein
MSRVTFKGKCTTCKKSFDVTAEQQHTARHCGVIFSACCNAVATVTTVTVKRSSTRVQKTSVQATRVD